MQLIVTKPYGIFVECNNKGDFKSEGTGGFLLPKINYIFQISILNHA